MPWPTWKKVGFQFLFAYLVLYINPLFHPVWAVLVPPVGRLLSVKAIRRDLSGSGDTAFHWVQLVVIFALALVTAALWTLLDHRREDHRRLALGFRVFVRLSLGMALISYGVVKVVQSQFAPPALIRLEQPMGQFSPMGLLWTFMGASRWYNLVTGFAEMIPGMLLFFPRTALLGSLLAAGAIANVVALNFCYDVPVKLYSLHLLGMALFVAAPESRRLVDFFFRAEPSPVAIASPRFQRGAFGLKVAALLLVTAGGLWSARRDVAAREGPSWTAVRGIWEVREFRARDGGAAPIPETERWKRAIFDDRYRRAAIHWGNGRQEHLALKVDEVARKVFLDRLEFAFTESRPDELTLTGTNYSRKVVAVLRRDARATLLLDRGFHWVTEFPFNR